MNENPTNAEEQCKLGMKYYIGDGVPEDSKKALFWLSKAAEQGNIDACMELGTVCCVGDGVSNDPEKAIYWFTKAAEQGHAMAFANRAKVYLELKQYQHAISDCNKAIELVSDDDEEAFVPYANRGLAYVNMGELDKAVKDYDKVIELAPENAEAYTKRGFIYSQLGKSQDAIRDYEKLLELDPGNANAVLVRGELARLRDGGISHDRDGSKSGLTLLLLSIFLGWLGVDRFYAGKTVTGILKLITGAACGIWWLVDLFLIFSEKFTDSNGNVIVIEKMKWIVVVIFSVIGLIVGISGVIGAGVPPEGAAATIAVVIWICLGIGGNLGITMLQLPVFIGVYRKGRERGESLGSALGGTVVLGILFVLLKSLAGPIIPIVKIAKDDL